MIYQGFLNIDSYGVLTLSKIDGEYTLAEVLEKDFENKIKTFVSVRYYITDKEVTLEQCTEALIYKTIGGSLDNAYFILSAYSEYTIEELEENFIVGGHNLIDELKTFDSKYLTLIVEDRQEKISKILDE